MKWFSALIVVTLLFGCDTERDSATSPFEPSTIGQSIVNGTRDPQVVDLTDAEILALGWLYWSGAPDQPYCTATLFAPDLVITAAHCVFGPGGMTGFGVGVDPNDPDGLFMSDDVFINREVDAAIIKLSEDATAGDLDITPIPINQDAIDDDAIDRAVQAGGYGETRDETRDGRWFATVYIYDVSTEEIVVDGRGDQGICYGDSGGPLIDVDADGNPVILAVESGGDDTCVDIDYMTRLDTIYDWVQQIIDGDFPEDPCDGIPAEGRCDGDVFESCRRGTLRQVDCTELGTECAYNTASGTYGCTCGDLSEIGWCDGDTAENCVDGLFLRMNCSRRDMVCGYSEEEGQYTCVDDSVCLPEDAAGRCDGDTAINCADGLTTREICAADGRVCVETDDGADCVDSDPGDPTADMGEDADAVVFPDLGDLSDETGVEVDNPKSGDTGGCGCSSAPSLPGTSVAAFSALALVAAMRRRKTRGCRRRA